MPLNTCHFDNIEYEGLNLPHSDRENSDKYLNPILELGGIWFDTVTHIYTCDAPDIPSDLRLITKAISYPTFITENSQLSDCAIDLIWACSWLTQGEMGIGVTGFFLSAFW